jgi:hypothetical protein
MFVHVRIFALVPDVPGRLWRIGGTGGTGSDGRIRGIRSLQRNGRFRSAIAGVHAVKRHRRGGVRFGRCPAWTLALVPNHRR